MAAAVCALAAVSWAPLASGADPEVASLSALRMALDGGDFDAAIREGERFLAAEPGNSEAHDLLGRAYGRKAEQSSALAQWGLARKARASFAQAVALDPTNAAALADLATYDMRAPAFLGGGREKSRREAQAVLRLDPPRGHELLGALAEREGDAVVAEKEYGLASAAAPGDVGRRRGLSGFLVRHGRFAEARALWLSLHQSGEDGLAPSYELAGIALQSGERLSEALEDLEGGLRDAALSEDPRAAEVHARLAYVAERLGRKAEARDHLTEALRLEPRQREWQRALARLSR